MQIPSDIPPEVVGFLEEMGYLEADRLQVGASVPALTLTRLHAEGTVTIGAPDTVWPTVLIFGSYT
jgi:hypothetical protein